MKSFLLLFILLATSSIAASVSNQPPGTVEQAKEQAQQLRAKAQQIHETFYQKKYNQNNQVNNNFNVESDVSLFAYLRQGFDLPIGIGLLILAALLFVWLFWPSRVERIKKRQTMVSSAAVEEGEYDYLNSMEAMPAKLDLARAYIDMGEHSNARQILEDVLVNGNAEQRTLAQTLLGKI